MTKAWLISIWLLIVNFGFAQNGDHDLYDHDLNENKWEDIRNGIRYEGTEPGSSAGREWTYENNEEYRAEQRRINQGSSGNGGNGGGGGTGGGGGGNGSNGSGSGASSPSGSSSSSPPPSRTSSGGGFMSLSWLGWVLLGVFLVGFAILIYYMFVNAPKDGKEVGEPIDFEDVNPTEIPLTELQRLLQEALDRKDYRGAVRIYFIFIIRDLAEKGLIQWEKEKTNFHYIREMSGRNEFDDFNRSVSFFEIIWYGKRDIDEEKFNQVKPNFTRFLDKLGVK